MDRPTALTIAGSDPSGGAGIQADLKTFHQLGAYGTAVITALTAQNTQGVTGVHVVPADFVAEQLETLLADVRIDAVKMGMLATAQIAETVGRFLAAEPLASASSVLDPVMVATSGDRLVDEDATDAIRRLVPLVSVITPNVPEASVLLGEGPAVNVPGMRTQAEKLRTELGAQRVLLKGGHLGGAESVDVWADADGVHEFADERVDTKNTHGTGCTLSSALAALRPQLSDWPGTAVSAKGWLTTALTNGDQVRIGHGHGPVDHFTELHVTRGTRP